MFGKAINYFINYLSKNKSIFVAGLVVLLSVFLLGISKIKINESIFSVLPKGNSFSKFTKLIDEGSLSNHVVFLLEITPEEVEEFSQLFSDSLTKYSKDYLTDVVIERPDVELEVYDYFHTNFPLFISDNYYEEIEGKISKNKIKEQLALTQQNLLSPGGFVFKQFLLKDPLGISTSFFQDLNESSNFSNVNVQDGYVFNASNTQLIVTAKTKFKLSDNENNILLYAALNSLKAHWNKKYTNHPIDYFGTFQVSAENSIQVKKDTYLTLIITIIVILLILFVYYRKILIPLYFMLPLIFGGLFALGMLGFFKSEISGISLATGAVVFGIVLDFSFHFFTHLQHSKSISKTISEISNPMLTGALTTILAFGALIFTNSVVLQDFGLFAALSLFGAAFFVLIGLPVILKLLKFNTTLYHPPIFNFNFSFLDRFRTPIVAIIFCLTGVFFYFSFDVQFDENLDNLSFHSQSLKDKETEMMGINPSEEKKLFLFSESVNYEEASLANYNLYQKVKTLQKEDKVKSVLSLAKFIVPDSIASYKINKWDNFWLSKTDTFITNFDATVNQLGFNESAFLGFKDWITKSSSQKINTSIIATLGLSDFLYQTKNKTSFITTLVVKKEIINEVALELEKIDGISSFNRAEVANELLSVVKDDFNYILIVSSLLVLICLLLIYGRIELALITFIPMVISWVWILGIAAIFDVKFNFVNIVIATFIFGLGDDFSIFVTDGLLHQYKYKKRTLKSYNTAIFLSGLTTMIGTGVLFFAKHPAIHSVALISVLGILCILLISRTVQPFLFNVFIQKRVDKNKAPLTFIAFIISIFEFTGYVVGCLLAYLILAVLYVFPLPKKNKRYFLNCVLSYSAWFLMYTALQIKKRIYKEDLDLNQPSIIITNHTSFLDILMALSVSPKILIVVKDWVYNSILSGPLVRYAGYIYVGDGPEDNLVLIKERLQDGYSILIFPEGSRSPDDKIKRFHKGAFFLAQHLNLDITPLLTYGCSYVLPKTEYFVKHGNIHMKFLPRIKADDLTWGDTFGKRTKSISKFFKAEYLKFKDDQEDSKVLFNRVFSNYVYKGPFLEWYLRVKWKFEGRNFETYNALLKGKNKILDIGCGYGYLSYFLHYKDESRMVLGVDYDEEKINIAQNGFDHTSNLNFEAVDITSYQIGDFDGVILSDVLHYFSKEKQENLLKQCALSLSVGGVLLIRDGITDFKDRHQKTKLTELFSTKLLSFNKKEEDFYFFSSNYIKTFALSNNFTVQMEEQSKKTSNVLFILRKQ